MDYPKMLYREGATWIVLDAAEHEACKAEGWRTYAETYQSDPLDHDGDGRKGGSRKKAR